MFAVNSKNFHLSAKDFDITRILEQKQFTRRNKTIVILKTKRFNNIILAVIINSVSFQLYSALLTLLTMTAKPMLSKCPVLRITNFIFPP